MGHIVMSPDRHWVTGVMERLGISEVLAGDLLEEYRGGRSAFWLWRQALWATALAVAQIVWQSQRGERMKTPPRVFAASIARQALVLAISWLVALALVRFGERALGGWPAAEIGQTAACVLGVGIALILRARFAAFLLAAMTAFSVAELATHFYYGLRAAQGAPTHFAGLGAAMLGSRLVRCWRQADRRRPASGHTPGGRPSQSIFDCVAADAYPLASGPPICCGQA